MIYRELARRTANEAIVRAGLVLSVDQSLSDAHSTYEAWTEALIPIVIDAIRSGALDCAESMSRLADTLCAGFVGAVKVSASLGENDTITRRVDDLLMMWRGTDPAPRLSSYTEQIHRNLFSDFQEPPIALTESRPRR